MNTKFRGCSKKLNCWIYGDLIHTPENTTRIINHTPTSFGGIDSFKIVNELVEPDSVGMFTGFTDKDGNEIYGGDIISFTAVRDGTQHKKYRIYFNEEGGAWYCYNGGLLCDILVEQNNDNWKLAANWSIRDNQYVRIIGTIFENPEIIVI